jgi:peptide/nickel transport system substrate-binding protein
VAVSVFNNAYDVSLVNGSIPAIFYWPAFDGLTWVDRNGKVQPGLASSWSSDDGQTWTFKLRTDVNFHDGTPLQAQDVVGTFQYYANPANKARFASQFANATFAAPDPATVMVTLPTTVWSFPAEVALALVVKGRQIDPNDPQSMTNYMQNSPVGTGPYKLVNFKPSDTIQYDAMPSGFVSPRGPAAIQTLIFRQIADSATRLAALRAGDIQLDYDLPYDSMDQLKQQGYTVGIDPGTNEVSLNLDTSSGPTQDVRVRQAINYAIDKTGIVNSLRGGVGVQDGQLLSQQVLGHNPNIQPYPYDPAKARQLLADAGYPNGFDIGNFSSTGVVFSDTLVQAIQANLEDVGITSTINMLDAPVWVASFYAPPSGRQGIWAYALNWEQTWEAESVYRWWSSDLPTDGGRRWTDEKFDAMYLQAKGTQDPTQRAAAYQQVAQYMHDQAPVAILWENSVPTAWDTKKISWNPGLFADAFTSQLTVLQ